MGLPAACGLVLRLRAANSDMPGGRVSAGDCSGGAASDLRTAGAGRAAAGEGAGVLRLGGWAVNIEEPGSPCGEGGAEAPNTTKTATSGVGAHTADEPERAALAT